MTEMGLIRGKGANRVVVGCAKVSILFDGCKTISIFARIKLMHKDVKPNRHYIIWERC